MATKKSIELVNGDCAIVVRENGAVESILGASEEETDEVPQAVAVIAALTVALEDEELMQELMDRADEEGLFDEEGDEEDDEEEDDEEDEGDQEESKEGAEGEQQPPKE